MKRRITQISLALLAVVTLSACIIIQSERETEFTTPQQPEAAQER